MKKQIAAGTLIVVLLAVVAGCVTKGPSDLEMVQSTTNTFVQGLVTKNVDAAMAVVSPDFYNPDAGDKAGLRTFIMDAIDQGYLDYAEADMTSVEYTIEGDKANVYPIVINSAAGSATIGLELTKKDGAWMVTGMEVEGV